jgi:hypothetical protein
MITITVSSRRQQLQPCLLVDGATLSVIILGANSGEAIPGVDAVQDPLSARGSPRPADGSSQISEFERLYPDRTNFVWLHSLFQEQQNNRTVFGQSSTAEQHQPCEGRAEVCRGMKTMGLSLEPFWVEGWSVEYVA